MPDQKPPETPVWASDGMSPDAKRLYQDYLRWLREDFADAEALKLVVLIWGPGPKTVGKLFQKRDDIRSRLRDRGDLALFSEELDEACRDFSASAKIRELFQARRADFIVTIYGSPGSIAEVHDMAAVLGTKILIFVDSRYVGGYGFTGLLGELKAKYNNVETFRYPRDIDKCHLLTAVEAKLKELRIAKWLAKEMGVRL